MKQSCGTLLFRRGASGIEVLLVHASGSYNKTAAWGIPKGVPDPDEDLEACARRETIEETGVRPDELASLGSIIYTRSRKKVHCFAGPAPSGVEPALASWEIDRAEFLPLEVARQLIHPDQAAFLDRLEEHLKAARRGTRGDGRA